MDGRDPDQRRLDCDLPLMAGTQVNVIWRGDAVLAQIRAAAASGMEAAGRALVSSTVSDISTPYPPASRPGQPPHRRGGGLRRGVGSTVVRSGTTVALTVGVPRSSPVARQARALQGGTSRMAARPFMPTPAMAKALVVDAVTSAVRSQIGR